MADPIDKAPPQTIKCSTQAHFHYHVYGRRLCSNVPLRELPPAQFDVKDLAFRYEPPAKERDALALEGAVLLLRRATSEGDWLATYTLRQGYLLRGENLCDFVISLEGREIRCYPTAAVDQQWVTSALYGIVLSFALHLMAASNLHASAVALPSGAIGFLAAPGTGKSSLAALFSAQGYPFLTDDVLTVQEQSSHFIALPGFPYTSLSARTLQWLGLPQPQSALTRGDKTRIAIDETWASFCEEPLPLRALFILNRAATNQSVTLEPLPQTEALRELLENTTSLALLPARYIEQHMAFLLRMTSAVPTWRLSYSSGLEHLREVADQILEKLPMAP